jgi:hypothetical protein
VRQEQDSPWFSCTLCPLQIFQHCRDSKLTALLADSLGRKSFSVLIACVATEPEAYGDTLSTLRWVSSMCKSHAIFSSHHHFSRLRRISRVFSFQASRARLVQGVVGGGKPPDTSATGTASELAALRAQVRHTRESPAVEFRNASQSACLLLCSLQR